MRFGVMSDTHGNHAFGNRAAERMTDAGAEFIYHLGDDYEDAELLRFAGFDVRAVPGLWCEAYRNGTVPKIIEDHAEGVSLACAHTLEDLKKHGVNAALYFFGHTHTAIAECHGEVLHVNPGHLKRDIDRGENASYALADIDAEYIAIAIHELAGGERFRHVLQRSALGC